jgi:hypothetical protein
MISRGLPGTAQVVPIRPEPESAQAEAAVQPVAVARTETAAPAANPDYHLIHYRLAALERLSALKDKGSLSFEEFAVEKALVLRLPAEEMVPPPETIMPPRGPSLLGRLFGWKPLMAGALAGLCYMAATAPRGLAGLLDQASRYFT